jgi:hypothetical protein
MGVAIVAFATRHVPSRRAQPEQDTAWGEPPVVEAPDPHPFAHAPVLQTVPEPAKETERLS